MIRLWRESREFRNQCWREINTTLTALAEEADLLLTGRVFEDAAANVAEYYHIPLATLHYLPVRPDGRLLPSCRRRQPLCYDDERLASLARDEETRPRAAPRTGLPTATGPSARRIADRGSLEIQAYDEITSPAGGRMGGMDWEPKALCRPADDGVDEGYDDEVASWIAAGTPPIFFGFGSMPFESPADTIDMIASRAELGARALVGPGWSGSNRVPHFEHVKVVGAVNHAWDPSHLPRGRPPRWRRHQAAGLRAVVPP